MAEARVTFTGPRELVAAAERAAAAEGLSVAAYARRALLRDLQAQEVRPVMRLPLSDALLQRVEAWRQLQPGRPSLQEALRFLLDGETRLTVTRAEESAVTEIEGI